MAICPHRIFRFTTLFCFILPINILLRSSQGSFYKILSKEDAEDKEDKENKEDSEGKVDRRDKGG